MARVISSSWFLGAVIATTAAPLWVPLPAVGLDPSWQAAMHMAARQGVDFGSGIDFTYGPLGFLAVPSLYYSSTAALAVVFTFAVRIAACVVFLRSARSSAGIWFAIPCTYLAARALRFVDLSQAIPVLVLLGCLVVMGREGRDQPAWFAPAAGAFSGFLLLVKFNGGLVVVAIFGLAVLFGGDSKLRSVAVFLGSFFGSVVLWWLVTGNSVGDLPAWVSASLQIASGFSTAMGIEAERELDFVLVGPLVLLVALALWFHVKTWPFRARLGAGAMLAVLLFGGLKHGFVRHDEHALSFFGVVPGLVLGLGLSSAPRRAVAGFLVAMAVFVAVNPFSASDKFDPRPSVRSTMGLATDMVSGQRRGDRIMAGREAQRVSYALESETLAALGDRSVHVSPWETSVVWAYPELEWRPLPIFQAYSVYTASLDRRNAEALSSPDGPERILNETSRAIDGRNPDFESPEAVKAMLCNYAQISATSRWQVLARVDRRCGKPIYLGSVVASSGQVVNVPPPKAPPGLVVAHLRGVQASPGAAIISALYKAPEVYMETDDGTRFRIVPETASGPLLMSAPLQLGYAPQFGFARQIRSFRLSQRRGFGLDLLGSVTVEFFHVPLV